MKHLNIHATPHYDHRHHRLQCLSDEIIAGWSGMVRGWFDEGLEGYFFTFLFNRIPGNHDAKWSVMQEEIRRVHRKLTERIVRNPRNSLKEHLHPRCVVCPDYRVPKHKRINRSELNAPNGGLHAHGIVAVPPPWDEELAAINFPQSRLREPLDEHFLQKQSQYTNQTLYRIDVRRIEYGTMADYLFKTIKHGNAGSDDVLVV